MSTPWKVTREWEGQTVAILAGGCSLTRADVDRCRGRCKVIAISNTGIDTIDSATKALIPAFAPWADLLYAADGKWWTHYQDRALAFPGRKVANARVAWDEVHSLERSHELIFDKRPTHLASGGNSGYQALHLAVHLGCTRIVLLGYDMKHGNGGRRHWFGSHPKPLDSRANFAGWIRSFDRLARILQQKQIEVTNCTRDTALRCFKRTTIERVFGANSSGTTPAQGAVRVADGPAESGHGRDHADVAACV